VGKGPVIGSRPPIAGTVAGKPFILHRSPEAEMSGQEYRFELKIAERHMPAISARLWLQRGVALGRLLRALANQTTQL